MLFDYLNKLKMRLRCIIRYIFFSKKYYIVCNPNETFCKLCTIKEDSWEDSYCPPNYMHSKEQHLSVFKPAQYIYKTDNGVVFCGSDVVITSKGVYWYKYNEEEFLTWFNGIPDTNVISYRKGEIRVRKYTRNFFIKGKVLSLLGVYDTHWVHFLFQYLPKLYISGEAGLFDNEITVLVPQGEDLTIIEIINRFLVRYPKVKLVYAEKRVNYICDQLLFAPCSQYSWLDYNFRLDYPACMASYVSRTLNKYLIEPLIDQVKDSHVSFEKIFLGRSGLRRTLINYEEVHDFFYKKGFVDVDGSKLTLEEKANIFYHAKEVVGLNGGGLLNLIFGNKTKVLVFSNLKLSTDSTGYILYRDKVSRYTLVTGSDFSPSYHTDFYIPLEKIMKAYNECICES